MISMTFIQKASDLEAALKEIDKIIIGLSEYFLSYRAVRNEKYDKFKNSYRTICSIETKIVITENIAIKLLNKIADKWEWDECKSSAWSSKDTMGSIFSTDNLIFVNSWFEDLE